MFHYQTQYWFTILKCYLGVNLGLPVQSFESWQPKNPSLHDRPPAPGSRVTGVGGTSISNAVYRGIRSGVHSHVSSGTGVAWRNKSRLRAVRLCGNSRPGSLGKRVPARRQILSVTMGMLSINGNLQEILELGRAEYLLRTRAPVTPVARTLAAQHYTGPEGCSSHLLTYAWGMEEEIACRLRWWLEWHKDVLLNCRRKCCQSQALGGSRSPGTMLSTNQSSFHRATGPCRRLGHLSPRKHQAPWRSLLAALTRH